MGVSTEFRTTYTCDKCETSCTYTKPGDGFLRPEGWEVVRISYKFQTDYHNSPTYEIMLCDKCIELFNVYMGPLIEKRKQ